MPPHFYFLSFRYGNCARVLRREPVCRSLRVLRGWVVAPLAEERGRRTREDGGGSGEEEEEGSGKGRY